VPRPPAQPLRQAAVFFPTTQVDSLKAEGFQGQIKQPCAIIMTLQPSVFSLKHLSNYALSRISQLKAIANP
jgi:hypothetical protein